MKGPITIGVLAVATAALIAAILGDTEALFAPKPVSIVGRIIVDYSSLPPATPEQMLGEADAVVVAKYTGRHRPIEREEPRGLYRVESTNYQFEIVETLKFHPLLHAATTRIDINMEGGEKELATYVERTEVVHTEPLHRDHTYVAVFHRNTVRPELYLAWGAGGLYDITGTMVEPVDRERRRYADLSVVAFLERLRAATSR